MNLIGYLNRSRLYPTPLISVGREGNRFFAIFPTGERALLKDISSTQQLVSRPTYVQSPEQGSESIPQMAFGLAPDRIVAGSRDYVGRMLSDLLKNGTSGLSIEDAGSIRKFLIAIHSLDDKLIVDEIDSLSADAKLLVRLEQRTLRRRKGTDKTIVLQSMNHRGVKTIYRKNIKGFKNPGHFSIPQNVSVFLQRLADQRAFV